MINSTLQIRVSFAIKTPHRLPQSSPAIVPPPGRRFASVERLTETADQATLDTGKLPESMIDKHTARRTLSRRERPTSTSAERQNWSHPRSR